MTVITAPVTEPIVRTQIERADAAAIARLGECSSATIHEAQGRKGALSSVLKPIDDSMKLVGSAFTVECAPRDNITLQYAIHFAQPGDVLVVSTGEHTEAGYFGGVLANACQAKGIAGLVIDGGVRDTAEIRDLGFPVFTANIAIQGTVKETLGPLNRTISIGGQIVHPGDVLVGDCDGLVVVRRDEVEWATEVSVARDEKEAGLIEKYRAGGTTIELCGIEGVLEAKGLTTDLPGRGF
jgi:4-hydroxy-4-methyl-2-oxoglutarate aldolase